MNVMCRQNWQVKVRYSHRHVASARNDNSQDTHSAYFTTSNFTSALARNYGTIGESSTRLSRIRPGSNLAACLHRWRRLAFNYKRTSSHCTEKSQYADDIEEAGELYGCVTRTADQIISDSYLDKPFSLPCRPRWKEPRHICPQIVCQ